MKTGLIQVYTGDGKGKTTAAIGQGIRALGRGNKVYIVQFLKSGHSGELETIKKLEPDFSIFRFEKPRGFVWTLNEQQLSELKAEVESAFDFIKSVMKKKECDLLIMDEIMGVLGNNLLEVSELVELLKAKPECMEIVLTGRNVPDEIIGIAHYVSEIKCIKHPYENGISAREGIEY